MRSSRYEACGKFGEQERWRTTADARINCFSCSSLNVFSRHLFADVISVHNGNMKDVRATKFDYTNLLAMLQLPLISRYVYSLITAKVVETSVTVTDNSRFEDYPHPDDHTT